VDHLLQQKFWSWDPAHMGMGKSVVEELWYLKEAFIVKVEKWESWQLCFRSTMKVLISSDCPVAWPLSG